MQAKLRQQKVTQGLSLIQRSKKEITHFFLQRVAKTMFDFKMSQAEFVSPDICDCKAQAIRGKMPFLLVHSVAG